MADQKIVDLTEDTTPDTTDVGYLTDASGTVDKRVALSNYPFATDAEFASEQTTRANADTALDGRLDTLEAVSVATDAELAAAVAAEAALARNADNLTSGTLADARIASTIARDSEVTSAVAAEATLARNADNLTSGTVADARIASTIARDTEVTSAVAAEATLRSDADTALDTRVDALEAVDPLTQTEGDARYWQLATDLATQAELNTHEADTTNVHGIGNTANLETTSGAQTKADAAQAASQPVDSDLTTIAGLSPSNDDVVQRKAGAWTNRTPAQLKTDLLLAKGDVGLGNVDNTSDANKPVSTAQQTALDAKAPLVSPALTGNPTAPTASQGDSDTSIATTAFVNAEIAADADAAGAAAAAQAAAVQRANHTGTQTASTISDFDTQVASTAVLKSLYDANSIVIATSDNTPIVKTVAASSFLGRKSSGDIDDMTVAEALTELATTEHVAPDFKATGKTGLTASPAILAGGTTSGFPTTGAHVVGEIAPDALGRLMVCNEAGTPGKWCFAAGTLLGAAKITTTQSGIAGTATDVTGGSVTFTAPNQSVLIKGYLGAVNNDTVGSGILLQIYEDGAAAIRNSARKVMALASGNESMYLEYLAEGLTYGTSYTFRLRLLRATSGNVTTVAAIGSSPAQVGSIFAECR